MKHKLKANLQRLFVPFAKKLGFVLSNSTFHGSLKSELLNQFTTNLKKAGLSPALIFDVGANRGTWTNEFINVFPMAHFVLFEPQNWLFEESVISSSDRKRTTFEPFAVGGSKGKMLFTLNGDRDDSSSLSISSDLVREKNWKQIEVEVVTIDSYIDSENLGIPEIIKIDAEGNDLDVLAGAKNCFGITEVFLVEAAVVSPYFENNVLEVVKLMDEKGYKLFEITDLNRPYNSPVLWLVELCFIKINGKVDSYYQNIDNLKQ